MNLSHSWYDNQIQVIYDLKQKKNPYLKKNNASDDPENRGSSSVEPITWGRTVPVNHDEDLKQWNHVPTVTEPKMDETQHPVTRVLALTREIDKENDSEGENEEYKEDPFYHPDSELTHLHADSKKVAREDRDDEQEFNRIPIAGEDSDDYHTSDDGEDEFEEE